MDSLRTIEYIGSLHNHTDYSNLYLRDSINTIGGLIDTAIALGHKVIAITEHETVSNAIKIEKYYNKIKEKHPDFKVIRGNEIYLCRDGLTKDNFIKGQDKFYHFILLALDAIGHEQIRELSTRAWMRSWKTGKMVRRPTYYQDLIDIIGANPGHIVGATACLGGFLDNKLLQYNENPDPTLWNNILGWCLSMQSIFGEGNFLLELQPSKYKEQKIANGGLLKLSEELDIPYIITTDSHYARPEDAPIHEAFLNAQEGEREVKSFYATTYLMSGNELNEFIEEEIIAKANETIAEVAARAQDYSLMKPLVIPSLVWNEPTLKTIPGVYFKRIPSLKKFVESSFNGDKVLARAIIEKLESDVRLQTQRIYDEIEINLQMTWESSEVNNAHWSAYFLNLQKIIEVCWDSGTLVGCGRGSGVGFILLYLLDIIQINPLWETTKLYPWRFLNPSRVSVLDIDTDIEGGRRAQTLQALRDFYGQDRVSNVITFRTEKSKSALQTAARGLGIDVDISLYLASLVPVDRGIARTLKQCYYGDEENGFKPVPEFVRQMKLYPELWSVAQKIEGLVCGIGEHAGGVIFVDEPFTKSTALMRVPNGDVVTQFDLHDSEDVSLIKIDLLSVEALDKIHTCLDLLVEYKYLEPGTTLKETYEKAIGVYNLERENKDMWKMIWSHKIESLFQMEKQSGVQGIALTKPECLDDLATLNSVIRLMAQEPGDEQPLNKYARFKKDISLWYAEMDRYGLTKEEQKLLEPILKSSYGICESQERFMMLVQLPECGGMSLTWADSLRKSIAKKNPAAYMKLQEEYYKTIEEKGLSQNLCHYVWGVLVATSRGYGFNLSHTLAYSIIGLQEMNLCFRYPIIFWNCACLITDSGAAKENESADYNKIAIAIGKMKKNGIKIIPPDVNKSEAIFAPDVDNNCIYYGFKSLVSVGDDVISQIISNRPFVSVPDFLNRVKLKKPAVLSLIKSGAFDSLEPNRMELMGWYIWRTCDKKKRLTLQNMRKLILEGLVPSSLNHERAVFEFNRYLKSVCKSDAENYKLDERALSFIENNYLDLFSIVNYDKILNIKQWDKIYQKEMDNLREWLKEDGEEVLFRLNEKIFKEDWDKYVKRPNYSSWEMESTCLYFHEHELKNINNGKYGLRDFETLSVEPRIAKSFEKGGRTINMFELSKIIGTVIAKDKNKNIISLLTRGGTVVTIKFPKAYYSIYDKQISIMGEDGKKKIIEKSWFTKGNMLVINGMRRGDNDFVAKKYASQGGHTLYRVSEIDDFGNIMITSERARGIEEEGEE